MNTKTQQSDIATELKKQGIYIIRNNRLQHFNVTEVVEENDKFTVVCGDQISTVLYKEGVKPQTFGEIGQGDTIYRMEFNINTEPVFSKVEVKGVYEADSEFFDDLIEVVINDPAEPKRHTEKKFEVRINESVTRMMGINRVGIVLYTTSKEKGMEVYNNFIGNFNRR